ncbi:MAG: PorP/SprF family type IX secretion system membrane protein [Chitinophagales bacterium]|nr:PorP/SprF family type IX secretion system membrane protein [Chitinophagales bacterium]HAE13453.1 hypothetical protein [Bacteroidota bacterium]MCB9031754.1 PorP/SprF family type IX secretion system membrane protein [Chitinophagales bacterium]HAE34263.1 hypothetical protein [Bacteroidota bacterium]HPE96602.1 PorP/SprF family type IX secretion system membrane protein [Chitinophagales bacterium]
MKGIWYMILISFTGLTLQAQDVHFSQFYAAPLLVNPAQTGNFSGTARVGANYRDQWGSITVPYRTFDLYSDAGIQPGKSVNRFGIGLCVLSDQAGDGVLRSNRAQLSAAYHAMLNDDKTVRLSAGLSGGVVQRSLDFSKLTFDSQWNGYNFDSDLANQETGFREQFIYPDFGTGILLTMTPLPYARYYVGASALHLNQPEESFFTDGSNQLGIRYLVTGGAYFPVSEQVSMSPAAYLSMQKKALEVTTGTNFHIETDNGSNSAIFLLGLWYRYLDAAWFMAGYVTGNLTVSASYDFNFSGLTAASNTLGGLELAIIYTFNKSQHKDPLGCPAFE